MQIPLDNKVVVRVHIVKRSSQEDASALARSFRFHDEGLVAFFLVLEN